MSDATTTQRLTPTFLLRLGAICDPFDEAWKTGQRPRMEDYLASVPASERTAVLRELLAMELEWRHRQGEQPEAEEYEKRFPDDLLVIAAAFRQVGPKEGNNLPRIVGAYELLEEVGRGGMGVVYKARQRGLGRLVALKVILSGTYASEEERDRFLKEAEVIAGLNHPNIVHIHEVGEHNKQPYFSLEYCPGGSLKDRLNGSPLPPREAATLLLSLAGAMHVAHTRGVVHRDLKPSNVMLAEDGTPKVVDFGLARKTDEPGRTVSGAVLGTPSYMAPEQARSKGQTPGPLVDVYALGAVLYEILTGRPPFRAATALDTLEQVRTTDPVPPNLLQPMVPRDLETICLKCLCKEPERRYSSAAALAEDLGRFLRGEPIRARPVSLAGRLYRWCKRRPLTAALVGLLLLLFTGAVVAGTLAAERDLLSTKTLSLALQLDRILQGAGGSVKMEDVLQRYLDRSEGPSLVKLQERIVQFYQELKDQHGSNPNVVYQLAIVKANLGSAFDSEGATADAQRELDQSLRLMEELVARHPQSRPYRDTLATVLFNLARVDESDAALQRRLYERALGVQEQLVQEAPERADYRAMLAETCHLLARLPREAISVNEALEYVRRGQDLREGLDVDSSMDLNNKSGLAMLAELRGNLLQEKGEVQEGLRWLRRWREMCEELVHRSPSQVRFQVELARSCLGLGNIAFGAEQPEEAVAYYKEACAIREKLLDGAIRGNVFLNQLREQLAGSYFNLGRPHAEAGRLTEAIEAFEASRRHYQIVLDGSPNKPVGPNSWDPTLWRYCVGCCYYNVGECKKGLKGLPALLWPAPADAGVLAAVPALASDELVFGLCPALSDETLALYQKACPYLEKAANDTAKTAPHYSAYHEQAGAAFNSLGRLLVLRGRLEEAAQAFGKAVEQMRAAVAQDPKNAAYQQSLEESLKALRRTRPQQSPCASTCSSDLHRDH